MNKNKLKLIIFIVLFTYICQAQVKISEVNGSINQSSILEVESVSKGFLPPRIWLNTNTMALNNTVPSDGMVVYNTNFDSGNGGLNVWQNGRWNQLMDSEGGLLTTYLRLFLNSAQTIRPGSNDFVFTELGFNQRPASDAALWTSGSGITIRRAGLYFIVMDVRPAVNSTDEVHLSIVKNGKPIAADGFTTRFSADYSVSTMIYCAQNDVIRANYYHGGSVNTTAFCVISLAQMPANIVE